jgi:hypothetical protein
MTISLNSIGKAATAPPEPVALTPKPQSALQPPIDKVTNLPTPLRFPWLSSLTHALEPVATQKSPFPAAAALGSQINEAA